MDVTVLKSQQVEAIEASVNNNAPVCIIGRYWVHDCHAFNDQYVTVRDDSACPFCKQDEDDWNMSQNDE